MLITLVFIRQRSPNHVKLQQIKHIIFSSTYDYRRDSPADRTPDTGVNFLPIITSREESERQEHYCEECHNDAKDQKYNLNFE